MILRILLVLTGIIVILVIIRQFITNSDKIHFFATGLDSKFNIAEISTLWKLAKECQLENPLSLYVSLPSLNKCISQVISTTRKNGTEKSFKVQSFLARLYKFRTRIALDSDAKKGLDDTRSLSKGQKLRIILKGKGIFFSRILNNGHEIIVSMPRQDDLIKVPGDQWIDQIISVYLWRKGDASYVFDTKVLNAGLFIGEPCLHLQHTDNILRAQKRKSVRCQCNIPVQMYIIKSEIVDFNVVENTEGYKCLLEDISENGAMIRIGGKGQNDVQIKLQFTLNKTFIMMYGIVRGVEYNESINQSRLHFECTHIEEPMRNAILSFVYNTIPQEEKDINEAIVQTESDALEVGDSQEQIEEANRLGARKTSNDELKADEGLEEAVFNE